MFFQGEPYLPDIFPALDPDQTLSFPHVAKDLKTFRNSRNSRTVKWVSATSVLGMEDWPLRIASTGKKTLRGNRGIIGDNQTTFQVYMVPIVGGFVFNPFEKYCESQIGSFPQGLAWK